MTSRTTMLSATLSTALIAGAGTLAVTTGPALAAPAAVPAAGQAAAAPAAQALQVVLRPWPVYAQGATEDNVAVLQYLLRGYSDAWRSLAVDGVYGPETATAVRDYQTNRGLAVDGVVGPQTWESLTHEAVLRADPRPSDWVRALQTELRRNVFDIAVDGVFGPQTEAAVREAQRSGALVVDGVAGPATWRDLITRHRI